MIITRSLSATGKRSSTDAFGEQNALKKQKVEGSDKLNDLSHPLGGSTNGPSMAATRQLAHLRACMELSKQPKIEDSRSSRKTVKIAREGRDSSTRRCVQIKKGRLQLDVKQQWEQILSHVENEHQQDPQRSLELLLTMKQIPGALQALNDSKTGKSRFARAQMLCVVSILIDYKALFAPAFSRITRKEIELHAEHVGKDSYSQYCPNLDLLSQRGNQLASRIAHKIAGCTTTEEKAAMIESYILIADSASRTQKYLILDSIIQGLNQLPASDQMLDAWNLVGKTLKSQFDNFCELIGSPGKDGHYRDFMKASNPTTNSGMFISVNPFLAKLEYLQDIKAKTEVELGKWRGDVGLTYHYARLKVSGISKDQKEALRQRDELRTQVSDIDNQMKQMKNKSTALTQLILKRKSLIAEIERVGRELPTGSSKRLQDAIERLQASLKRNSFALRHEENPQKATELFIRQQELKTKLRLAQEVDQKDLWKTIREVSQSREYKKHYEEVIEKATQQSKDIVELLVSHVDQVAMKKHEQPILFRETTMIGNEPVSLKRPFEPMKV